MKANAAMRNRFKGAGEIRLGRKLLPLVLAACFGSGLSWANPVGPQVVNGQVTFANQGNIMSITNTPGSIINWQSFSINPGELTRFLQQNSGSSVLNRITGQDPSQILGALQSNGKVFLINPNGILFGQGAQVDVNGLVASTLNISNTDFLANKLNFSAGDKVGDIRNQGAITTPSGGTVYLIAANVDNSGIVTSPNGDVVLAAGHMVQLLDSANPDLRVVVSAPESRALNLGQVIAQGGKIGIYGALINQRGEVNANSAVIGENGKVVFKASGDTLLEAGSKTTATGVGQGGEIQVLGTRVALTGNASIDASGNAGGGTVLVGGDYRGNNPNVQNAVQTYVGHDAEISANAFESGDGGKVIVWAKDTTQAYGSISVRGGAQTGNGGFIETSGHYLDVAGIRIAANAPHGTSGSWLLDPYDITLSNTVDLGGSYQSAGVWTATGGPSASTSIVSTTGIETILNSSVNVSIDTVGDGLATLGTGKITVSSPITWTSSSKLNLTAASDILINGAITETGATGTLSLHSSGGNISQAAPISVANLEAVAATGYVTLNDASNNVVTLAGFAGGTNGFAFSNSGTFAVGGVGSTGGISSNAGQIGLYSATGSIGGGGLVTGSSLYAQAYTGIGLRTQVSSVDAHSTSGDINITNIGPLALGYVIASAGNINIDNTGKLAVPNPVCDGPCVHASGNISLVAHSPLDVDGSITAGGNITLEAGASGSTSDQLTIGSTAYVMTTGSIFLLAGDGINLFGQVSGGTVSVNPFRNGTPAPTIDQCIANPALSGCSIVLPTLTTCIATPAALGCSVVLPTLSACITNPLQTGCSVVLPTLAQCTTNPSLAGCGVVLPTLAQCTADPLLAGCSVVLPPPTLAQCTANPLLAGCSAVLPTPAQCTANPLQAGCSVVLPTLTTCIANPLTTGCSAVLPTLATCVANPATAGCSVVVPTLSQCVLTPTLVGCSIVLPTLAQCTATPTLAGCSAVLPTASQCAATPTAAGCETVLPTTQTSTSEPIAQAINTTVNIINTSTATVTEPTATGKDKGEKKKDEKKDNTGTQKIGAKNDDAAKKMYCN